MKRFEKHIFVCENRRPEGHPKGCCAEKGSLEVREKFKQRLKELGLNPSVRSNAAGCLDACEHGITVLIYPEQVWYGGVKLDDVDEIISSHIIGNKPVERLMIKDSKFHKDAVEKDK
ncbi:MAG TPA: (2Fe-2S) ferredoxin domain-containing protein [Ignavibacteriaceae bacterium]